MGRNLRLAFLAVALTALVASACGGGGSGKKTATSSQTPGAVATATSTGGTPQTSATPQTPTTPKTPIPSATPRPTPTPLGSVEDKAAITAVIDLTMSAIQAGDIAGLRALFASGAPVEDAELNGLFTCMAETTRTQDAPTMQFTSGLARATVKFQRTSNGQTTALQGSWVFQKQGDGRWALYIAPFCPG